MARTNLNDLTAFLAVAEARSFTRAAARLGVSQSALSHTLRGLEERLGVRLLTRTTRSVTPTEAGERLVQSVGPRFAEIEAELAALGNLRDRPAGTIRISAEESATATVLGPALAKLLPDYPDIKVEIGVDNGLIDIVAQGFDAGVRSGDIVAKDMIAAPIGPPLRFVVVGSPDYFERHGRPKHPRDLTRLPCINVRLPTRGGLYAWEFEKGGREVKVRVDGQLIFNTLEPSHAAALNGLGLAFLPERRVAADILAGRLEQVLDDWCPPYAGYHLYYPSRRQPTAAFTVLLEALRWRG
jgi:DNA-binding transcriptional LysR family regulator